MTVETQSIIRYVETAGVPHRVTSTLRPGAVTAAGHVSRHAMGLAVDFAGPRPGRDTPELLAVFRAFATVEALLHELIYSGAPYNIREGRRVPRYAIAGHWDHVHVSVRRGVLLPLPTPDGGFTMPDDPNLPNMTGPVRYHFYVDPATGHCIGYHVWSEATGELHGHGAAAKFFGRSEVPTP